MDLILPCFEGSFRLGVKLASVNKELKLKMEEVSSAGWLRLCATGAVMAKRAELRTHLHVGELVLCTGYRLHSESLYSIIVHCPKLHTIKICPALGAAFVRQLQGDFIADYSIWPLIKPRVLRIVPRPVYCVWE